MAEALTELGVDVLEAGFAIATQGDFESVQAISEALRQGRAGDRQPVARGAGGHPALRGGAAGRRRGGASTSCSPPPTCTCGVKLRMSRTRCWTRPRAASSSRAQHADDVEWSAEDGSRSDPDFLCRCVEAAIKRRRDHDQHPGHRRLRHARGHGAHLRRSARRACRGSRRWSSPPTTTTTSAWRSPTPSPRSAAAPGRCETTINGIGERAGNASLEEVAMALPHPPRRAALPHRHRDPEHPADQPAARHHHRLRRAAEQGDRRPQRLRPRVGHPPGRRAQGRVHLRDHDAGERRLDQELASCSASTRAARPSATS